jgi:CheY-like chemotaxis protein
VRCLVIEPNLLVSDGLRARLRALGFVALGATSIQAAREHFRDELLWFILCDAVREIDAIATAREVWPSVAVIATTDLQPDVLRADGHDLARVAGAVACLPYEYDDDLLRQAIVAALAPRSRCNAPAHVMVIDDSRAVRAVAKSALSRLRVRVTLAENAEDALETIDLLDIDCVVSDIFMPGMGGIKGIAEIRHRLPTMPIVAMTAGLDGRVTPDIVLQAATRTGADALLPKPFDGETLSLAVRTAMHARRPHNSAN